MSLRAFHLLFVALSVALAAFFAAWAVGQYRAGAGAGFVVLAVACVLVAGGLGVYGAAFRRKTRHLG